MKRFKQFIALLLAIVMTLSAVPAYAGAAEDGMQTGEAGVRLGSQSAYIGSSACVPVTGMNLQNVAALDLEIYYDSDVLSYSYCDNSWLLSENNCVVNVNGSTVGVVKISLASPTGLSVYEDTLFWLYFNVKQDAKEGSTPVTLAIGDAYDTNLQPISLKATSGKVDIMTWNPTSQQFYVYHYLDHYDSLGQGDTVRMTMYNSNGWQFSSGDFIVEYDSSHFAVESVNVASNMIHDGAVYSINTETPGQIYVSYASNADFYAWELLNVTLKTISNVNSSTTVNYRVKDVYNKDLTAYGTSSGSFQVNLIEKEPEPEKHKLYLDMELEEGQRLSVGDTYETTLKLEEGAGVAAANFLLEYDTSVWECVEVKPAQTLADQGGMTVINHKKDEGVIKLSYLNEQGNAAQIDVLTITWKPIVSPFKHFEIDVSASDITDKNYKPLILETEPVTDCIYQTTTTAPTCTEDGHTTYGCNGCANKVVTGTTPALGHKEQAITGYAPTCTQKGLTDGTKCTVCKKVIQAQKEIPAKGHTEVVDPAVPPTCTETGLTQGKHCSVCTKMLVEQTVVKATGHQWDTGVVTLEPTEETEGLRILTCTVCKETKEETIPVLGHEHIYVATTVEPTCTERGYTVYTCRCNESYKSSYVNQLGHSMGPWVTVTPSTCIERGVQERTCTRCDHKEKQSLGLSGHTEAIDPAVPPTCTETGLTEGKHCSICWKMIQEQTIVKATGHQWDTGVVTIEPTEETEGQRLLTCTACKETKVEPIPTLSHEHNYAANVVAPTCTEQGYTIFTCKCGETYKGSYVNALGHSMGPWVTVTPSTCIERGVQERTCTRCDHKEKQSLGLSGHTEAIDPAVPPTCTETGLTEGKHCSVCWKMIQEQTVVKATGHQWDAGVVTIEPTEQTEGLRVVTCTSCKETKEEAIPVIGHEHIYVETVIEPTCTEQGYSIFTCRCNESYKSSYVNALGHEMGLWDTVRPATCMETGEQERKCIRCSHKETSTMPNVAHTEQTQKGYAATCTEKGMTDGKYCSVCNKVLQAQQEIPATGHQWDMGVITQEPTENSKGVRLFTCTVCKDTREESIPELSHQHKYSATIVAPTCTDNGYTVYICTCKDSYTDTHTAALGHSMSAWVTVTPATCTEKGIQERICTRPDCYHKEAGALVAVGHKDPTNDGICDACGQPMPNWENPFTDVQEGAFYYDAVQWAVENKITSGKTATTFEPTGPCTRAQVVTFLWRAAGEPEPRSMNNPFPDVANGKYFTKAVLWAAELGITGGYKDGTFRPDNTCTRDQIVTFLWRYMGQPEPAPTDLSFPDLNTSGFYYKAVLWAAQESVTSGYKDGTFRPGSTCTRDQIVTFLYRALV